MLKQGKPAQIKRMFQQFQAEAKGVIEECVTLTYYMRGALQYEDAMMRTHVEREVMSEFIKEHLERESKKPNPNY